MSMGTGHNVRHAKRAVFLCNTKDTLWSIIMTSVMAMSAGHCWTYAMAIRRYAERAVFLCNTKDTLWSIIMTSVMAMSRDICWKGCILVQHQRYTLKHNNDLSDGNVSWALLDMCQIGRYSCADCAEAVDGYVKGHMLKGLYSCATPKMHWSIILHLSDGPGYVNWELLFICKIGHYSCAAPAILWSSKRLGQLGDNFRHYHICWSKGPYSCATLKIHSEA